MKFGPLITAMVTPFKENGDVNYEEAVKLAKYLIDNGVDDLLLCGTTGEVPALENEEKLRLIEIVSEQVNNSANIIAGTGSYNTSHSIELSQQAAEAGADGLMLVVPYYNKPPQNSLYQHFSAIAENCKLPIMLYNVPSRTSRNLEPETTIKLSDIENIIAIKEASGDVEQGAMIATKTDPDFQVLSGDDGLTLPLMAVGGEGVVSVAAHIAPSQIKAMINSCKENDFHEAREIQKNLLPLFQAIFITTNPIPVKTAMKIKGWDVGEFRLPLSKMDEKLKTRLKEVLKANNYK